MSSETGALLRHKAINRWPLFFLIAIPMCLAMVVRSMGADLSAPPDVSSMIGFSVRFAVPLIFLVTATSALQSLFPGPLPAWLLRNRKYIGLCFAVAMAWQGAFIGIMSSIYSDYYYEQVFLFRDELEGTTGYIFLTAMVLTSFEFGRKRLTPQQWRVLHTSGLYFLWAYPFSTYWWSLSYYGNPLPHDHVYYWMGFTAFALRIAAWGKKRRHANRKQGPEGETPAVFKSLGGALIAAGLIMAIVSPYRHEAISGFLTAMDWSATLELWLPFWPYEPFLSLMMIGLGTMLATRPEPAGEALAPQTAD
jgi:DMSO/TMAO reductase YedYZ heme-binding membrane subunit